MKLDTGTETVVAEIADGVGLVVLHRPERRNALHPEMYRAVPLVLERFNASDDVGCIVITGSGSAFSAGGDVQDGGGRRGTPQSIEESAAQLADDARMVIALHESPKVTIAAVNGAAVGAGLAIALSTDLRIMARSARMIPGWGALGFSGDFGGPWLLTRLLGPAKAIEVFVGNVTLDADAALALGLTNRIVADDDLRTDALEWARTIAAGPRAAWARFKQNVRDAATMPLTEALPIEARRMVQSGRTDDHRRAVRAWFEAAAAKKAARDRPSGAEPTATA